MLMCMKDELCVIPTLFAWLMFGNSIPLWTLLLLFGTEEICVSIYNLSNLLFKTTGAIAVFGDYTESQLSVGITDIHCNGSEASILNCSHNNLEEYNCASHDDAGVICQGQLLLPAVIVNWALQCLIEQGIDDNSSLYWYCSNVTQ